MTHTCVQADAIAFLNSLEPDSVDLCFGSPPYEKARTYDIAFDKAGQEWVDWMVEIYRSASRACKGLCAFVVEGQTTDFRWSAVPMLLAADLHRAGFHLRRPCFFHRVGIPGSGGPDWLRADVEFIICVARPGKLPWSENTACGHAPRWAVGGALSYRNADGARKNASNGPKFHQKQRARHFAHEINGEVKGEHDRLLQLEVANPGNLISMPVGGGLLGSPLAHRNEAPFPERLCEFFILSFASPGGLVCDPFSGSGTCGAMAKKHGRNFCGCDIRESQVTLTMRRLAAETALMFT